MQQFFLIHIVLLGLLLRQREVKAFVGSSIQIPRIQQYCSQQADVDLSIDGVTQLLSEWDRRYNIESFKGAITNEATIDRSKLADAVKFLNRVAAEERNADSTKGRVMLGICASSAAEGIASLKSWVTSLELPRGLLHGMDQDGVPLQIDGAVYIKYNSGGVYTFADIRKSKKGFDALWKPGDAMLEMYDGEFRGVYFQVELSDGIFRQYLIPLDIFS